MQTCIWREGTETFCGCRAPTGVSLCHCAEGVFLFPNQMLKERKSNGSRGQRGFPAGRGGSLWAEGAPGAATSAGAGWRSTVRATGNGGGDQTSASCLYYFPGG